MNQPTVHIHIDLSEEEIIELEKLSALGYKPEQMAMYFQKDEATFISAANNPNSKIYYHIQRGQLKSIAAEQIKILLSAEAGNITASQELAKIRRNRGFEISKLDIFGSFDTKEAYEKLESYIQSGGKILLKNEESLYMDALLLMNNMSRKYGRRKTVEFFTKAPFNLKHSSASEMFDESVNLFYSDRNIERKALRNKKAEMLEDAAQVLLSQANSAKDFEVYGDLIMKAAKLQQLDRVDPVKLAKETYIKPVRYFSLAPEQVGLLAINRNDVAAQIEALEVPEIDKRHLRQDAMLEHITLEETLNELEEESRSK